MPNKTPTLEEINALSPQFSEKIPYLKMLVLFGSRATGHIHANSDWDFAALYDEEIRKPLITNPFAWFEIPTIISQILEIPDEKIDVVELNNCLPIIAHFVARDGKLLYEKQPGEFENFRKRALKSDIEMKKIRKTLREKLETNLQKVGSMTEIEPAIVLTKLDFMVKYLDNLKHFEPITLEEYLDDYNKQLVGEKTAENG